MMNISRTLKLRGGAAALAGAALLLSACGSSSKSDATAATVRPASSAPALTTIATAHGSMGTYLTGAGGRAIYLWVADSKNQSVCSGACAQVWPPVLASSAPKAGGSAKSSELGTIARSDGSKQVTYGGHPLYYYVTDTSAGMASGQGSDSFGAKWWLVAPDGSAITSGHSANQTMSSAGGGWG